MKKRLLFVPICLLLLCLLSGCAGKISGVQEPTEVPKAKDELWQPTKALLIGCDRFVTQPETTPASENNVAVMGEILVKSDPVTRVNGVGSLTDLEQALKEAFGDANEKDVCLLYISTHGILPENEDPAGMTFVFSDGEREERVSPKQLRDLLDGIPGRKILIPDTCYSGAIIGKGSRELLENCFASEDYLVITSCGAEERSWFWSSSGQGSTGTGYFTGALKSALTENGGFAGDRDGNGQVTLKELKKTLRELCGASSVQTWPENGDAVLMIRNEEPEQEETALHGIRFVNGALDREAPVIDFSFSVRYRTRLIYQVVYDRQGQWDFDDTAFLFDDMEPGEKLGYVNEGYKERSLDLGTQPEGTSGYALLQIIAMDKGQPTLPATHAVCMVPETGDPELKILLPEGLSWVEGRELNFTVNHAFPCELNVAILDEEDRVVAYVATGEPSRPQGREPGDSFFCWDGKDKNGNRVSPGVYKIRVRTTVGEGKFEAERAVRIQEAED